VVLGVETARSFLQRNVKSVAAIETIQERKRPGERLLLLGDGRSYYCRQDCLPDPEHFRWASAIAARGPSAELADLLKQQSVRYILLGQEDLAFLLQHDPEGVMRRALDVLEAWRLQGCLSDLDSRNGVGMLEVTCVP
jgi:hypothetical protein